MSGCTLNEIITVLEELAPFALAASWDNVGLMVGDPAMAVTGVLTTLDVVPASLDEAVAANCNCIVSHHPLIFRPLTALRLDDPMGAVLARAVRQDIAVVSCHTNLDVVAQGVSAVLARTLGVDDLRPLTVTGTMADREVGFGQLGSLRHPCSGSVFVRRVLDQLSLDVLRVAGPLPERVATVAVCGGSGSDLVEAAWQQGADLYVTGEIKHSTARWAEAAGFCVVDAGHFATEQVIVPSLTELLGQALGDEGWEIPVLASRQQQAPFRCYAGSMQAVRVVQ